jgi:drug/metabolite transporter (DMT)-like permease
MIALSTPVRFGLWMMVSCACFAVLVSIVRHVHQVYGLDVFVISFWRSLFSIVMFLPWFIQARGAAFRSDHHGKLFLRGALMVSSATAIFFAVALMPIAEATAISFTTPLFSVLLAVLILGERIGIHRSVALGVGMLGMLIILRPGIAVFDWVAILPILSALAFGGVVVIGRILAPLESPQKIAAYVGLWALPISLIPALFVWEWPDGEAFFWLIALGAAAALNMYAISRALRIGTASQTAPLDFLRLPFVEILAYLWFGQVSQIWTWLGAAVIFGSVIYVTWREARQARQARPRPDPE